jgi:glycine/D-amino acid oxidase-like deaminating enzyme
MAEWRRLANEIPDLKISWCGGLLWDLPPDRLEAYAAEHSSWGYGIRRVSREEAHEIEPHVAQLPDFAVHVAEEGAVEPVAAARALLGAARSFGAGLVEHSRVRRLVVASGTVVGIETEAGELRADQVVLAAGAGVPPLAASAGIHVPLKTPPGLLVRTKPVPKVLNGLVMSSRLHVRQTSEGRLIAGSDFGGGDPGSRPEAEAQALFAALQSFIKGGEALEYESYSLGYRPTPADDYPIIGAVREVENLYIAVMHSGITNAAAVGLLAATEILQDASDELAPFRLERFNAR